MNQSRYQTSKYQPGRRRRPMGLRRRHCGPAAGGGCAPFASPLLSTNLRDGGRPLCEMLTSHLPLGGAVVVTHRWRQSAARRARVSSARDAHILTLCLRHPVGCPDIPASLLRKPVSRLDGNLASLSLAITAKNESCPSSSSVLPVPLMALCPRRGQRAPSRQPIPLTREIEQRAAGAKYQVFGS